MTSTHFSVQMPMDLILPGWLGSSTTLHSPTPTVRVCAILSTALGPHEAWLLATCGGVIWHQESATATLRRGAGESSSSAHVTPMSITKGRRFSVPTWHPAS